MCPARILVVALLVTVAATTAPSTVPTTAPSTEPTTAPVAIDPDIQRQFNHLSDGDPAVRDAALEALMGLPSDALPRLLDVVRVARPLLPTQAAVLHEIVCHVFLAGEQYVPVDATDDPAQLRYVIGLRGPVESFATPQAVPLGVPVIERWPGFPARRVLRDGDLILGVYIDRQLPLERLPNQPTHDFSTLRSAIRSHPNVRDIDLSILRDGRQIRVSLTLAPQAREATKPELQAGETFLNGRQARADRYWQDHFAAEVDPAAGAPSVDSRGD